MNEEVDLINKLKEIKKDELSEREFYEQVLSIIVEMRKSHKITNDNKEIFVKTLREIGCLSRREWKEAKEKAGEKIEEDRPIIYGMAYADIRTAVTIISNYLSNPKDIQSYMNDRRFDEEWVENSIEVRNAEKTGKIRVPKILQLPDVIFVDFSRAGSISIEEGIFEMLDVKKVLGKEAVTKWKNMFYISTEFGNSIEEIDTNRTYEYNKNVISYSEYFRNMENYARIRDDRACKINKGIDVLFEKRKSLKYWEDYMERHFFIDNNIFTEKIDFFEKNPYGHIEKAKIKTEIKEGKEAVFDLLRDDVLEYENLTVTGSQFKETNIKQESMDKFREYVMSIENMIEERIELYEKNNMRFEYAFDIAYEDIYNDIENIKEVEEFEIEEKIQEENIDDIPSMPELNPDESEMPEGVQINEKGEIIREEITDQLSNTREEEITDQLSNTEEEEIIDQLSNTGEEEITDQLSNTGEEEITDQLSNSGKEEVTAIATRQKESKFKALVQRIKKAFSKKQENEHDDIRK